MRATWDHQPGLRPHLHDGENLYETTERVSYFIVPPEEVESGAPLAGLLTIPKGYLTDGASIPWALRWIIGQPFWPRFQIASLLHDHCYREQIGERRGVDDLFLVLLKKNGVGRIRSRLMWIGVRAGGWLFWGRCKRACGREENGD